MSNIKTIPLLFGLHLSPIDTRLCCHIWYVSGPYLNLSAHLCLCVSPLDLSVEVVPEENVTAGEVVDLYCGSCILSEAPAYVWLKDSDVVSSLEGTNQLLLDPAHEDDTGSYSCQVKGHEAAPRPVKLTVACK